MKNTEDLIYPGTNRINWNFTSIKEYISSCEKSIKSLNATVEKVSIIENAMNLILKDEFESSNLFNVKQVLTAEKRLLNYEVNIKILLTKYNNK